MAVKYRRLALVEPDPDKARLLQILADEAERGVLFTAEWRRPAAGVRCYVAVTSAAHSAATSRLPLDLG